MNRKMSEKEVKMIKLMLEVGCKNSYVAREFGISPGAVSDIKHGKTWAHVKLEDDWERPEPPAKPYKPEGKPRNAKLGKEQVARIKLLLGKGYTNVELAERYGVSEETISDIKRGITWAGVKPERFDGEEWEVPKA
ncbi:MAG: hypothetical protein QMD71_06360 [bacterium]|nr:hypothetical protein [bacterium]